jgi:hypothetical protein
MICRALGHDGPSRSGADFSLAPVRPIGPGGQDHLPYLAFPGDASLSMQQCQQMAVGVRA